MRVLARVLVPLAILTVLFGSLEVNAAEGRKVRSRVNPIYPELAKRINASGTVRVEVQIAPSGDVKSVKPLGGHPLFIPAAEDAVRKWKYDPAPETTTEVVEFRFAPGS
jgi:TonB family protein